MSSACKFCGGLVLGGDAGAVHSGCNDEFAKRMANGQCGRCGVYVHGIGGGPGMCRACGRSMDMRRMPPYVGYGTAGGAA